MQVSIPLYVHSDRPHGKKVPQYSVRPLFFNGNAAQDLQLGKATSRCVRQLRRQFSRLGRAGKYDELARLTFCPTVETRRMKLELELKSHWRREIVFVVTFRALDRRIAFLPQLDEMWFECPSKQTLLSRTQDVVREFLKQKQKDEENIDEWLDTMRATGRAWISTVDFEIDVARQKTSLKSDLLSFLSGPAVGDGATELENVGRCLDVRYPEGLLRCVHQDAGVRQLGQLLSQQKRRPILVVGRRMSGKTSLIHEVIYRRQKQSDSRFRSKNNTWLLSPQRLISGMSYVGQWENRLLAILKHARKNNHTLYFDDLPGLFRAGVSRDSDLNVAQVLKPWIQRREVRVLAEITPESLRILREQDRAFADQFHILRMDEPGEETALRILISVMRDLEGRQRVRFSNDVVPVSVDLCRRFHRNTAFPGNAAELLRSLSSRHTGSAIERDTVFEDFSRRSGLQMQFIDQSQRLKKDDIEDGLRENLVGQEAAVSALTQRICLARARLNDPGRPLGSFLLAGPTGVGKTQCARALADYLYGSEDRMIRFDMNEFVSWDAAARLVGTFHSPDGLLTSAVRRQPFSIVLLDEIEKAHPDVFDLLLQVLGEGRLTDALGQTVDFGNTFVMMTSNLGSRAASSAPGFGGQQPRTGAFLRAIEQFFRPEFVNRIDNIIPFLPLDTNEIRRITQRLVEEVSTREGFSRRRCILHPHPDVVERIVERGFEPRWGARGVRREIEKTVLQPVAAELARSTHTTPTVIGLDVVDGDIVADVAPLVPAERVSNAVPDVDVSDPAQVLERMRQFLSRAEEHCREHRPQSDLTAGQIDGEYFCYLNAMELIHQLQTATETFEPETQPSVSSARISGSRGGRRKNFDPNHRFPSTRRLMSEVLSADDVRDYLKDAGTTGGQSGEPGSGLRVLLRYCALLNLLLPDDSGWHDERAMAIMRPLQASGLEPYRMHRLLDFDFQWPPGASSKDDEPWTLGADLKFFARGKLQSRESQIIDRMADRLVQHGAAVMTLECSCAMELMQLHHGTYLRVTGSGVIVPTQIVVAQPEPDETPDDFVERMLDRLDAFAQQPAALQNAANPFRLERVLRIVRGETTVDVRNGQSATTQSPDQREQILDLLPVPQEFLSVAIPREN